MTRLVDEAAWAIGAAVGTVVNLFSPEVIVVGGGMAKASGRRSRSESGKSPSVMPCPARRRTSVA